MDDQDDDIDNARREHSDAALAQKFQPEMTVPPSGQKKRKGVDHPAAAADQITPTACQMKHPLPQREDDDERLSSPLYIYLTGDNDVLFGRGKFYVGYVGNQRYRELVRTRKDEYACTRFFRRESIAREIHDEIHRRGGRFLESVQVVPAAMAVTSSSSPPPPQNKTTGVVEPKKMNKKYNHHEGRAWVVAGGEKVLNKIKQSLRDDVRPTVRGRTGSSRRSQSPVATMTASAIAAPEEQNQNKKKKNSHGPVAQFPAGSDNEEDAQSVSCPPCHFNLTHPRGDLCTAEPYVHPEEQLQQLLHLREKNSLLQRLALLRTQNMQLSTILDQQQTLRSQPFLADSRPAAPVTFENHQDSVSLSPSHAMFAVPKPSLSHYMANRQSYDASSPSAEVTALTGLSRLEHVHPHRLLAAGQRQEFPALLHGSFQPSSNSTLLPGTSGNTATAGLLASWRATLPARSNDVASTAATITMPNATRSVSRSGSRSVDNGITNNDDRSNNEVRWLAQMALLAALQQPRRC